MDLKDFASECLKDARSLDYYEGLYPSRGLPQSAAVCRLAPSPTGFIHLGNLYMALADQQIARQSNGAFLLRIEDTDSKREVQGAIESLSSSLSYFGISFDEGILSSPEGIYGPYVQSERGEIYASAAKSLIEKGLAYPCFCSEDELAHSHKLQEEAKENFGYYGKWAKCRDLGIESAAERIKAGEPFTIRLRSKGASDETFSIIDGIRGKVTMPRNSNDVVMLKSNGMPTYHFAHVVDDHFMRITHVLRGEEWMSSLPIHIEMFEAMEWEHPLYCHTTLLMKIDNGTKRKLSKRKDPELGLEYYMSLGYHPLAVREYLMSLLNSNYEQWRDNNPGKLLEEFEFSASKMGSSGALFDLNKLNDISKNTLAALSADEIAEFMRDWAGAFDEGLYKLYADNSYLSAIAAIGRGGEKPRKDFIYARQIASFISFFYDSLYAIEGTLPEAIGRDEAKKALSLYLEGYSHADTRDEWFDKIKVMAQSLGYAPNAKAMKKEPGKYKGHVGDISAVVRLAMTGRTNAPDLWDVAQVMGEQRVRTRISSFISHLG
ncbi:MAG: glutamate--tRNA ligase [Eubacteriaceae bacterium]|nr:glutamate--tRNA ligase [Eubacteriaceae bacterium]